MLTQDDIHLLRHSLGIAWAHDKPYRNYCAFEPGHPQAEKLVRLGLLEHGKRAWQPVFPRGEVYSKQFTEKSWKSYSELHGGTPT